MDIYKKTILSLALFVSVSAEGALPVLYNYSTNSFETNAEPWRIAIKTSIVETFTVPFVELDEFWYDPFPGSALTIGGAIGLLGWVAQSGGTGGGAIDNTNYPGHFGVISVGSGVLATGMRNIFLSSVHNSKPPLPRLDNAIWTNRIVWRMTGTNDVRVYLVMNNGDITHNATLNQSMGFQIDTNSNQIKGYCATTGTPATTNLITLQDGTWYTNTMWCNGDAIIRFSVNDGATATLSANVTVSALTPKMGIVKTTSTSECFLEIDSWLFDWPQ